jgi:hypothetical protein
VKLLVHRLIARRLAQDATLVELARKELAQVRETREIRSYMWEWDALLSLPVAILRREIVRRDQRMTRLRISSPLWVLLDIRDADFRRQLWRSSRDALARRLRADGPPAAARTSTSS